MTPKSVCKYGLVFSLLLVVGLLLNVVTDIRMTPSYQLPTTWFWRALAIIAGLPALLD